MYQKQRTKIGLRKKVLTMAEYINREELLKDINDSVRFSTRNGVSAELRGAHKIVDCIRSAPACDVVEVVRCKDCKHFCPYEGEEHKGDCAELVGLESCVYEDDYCSYGERRSEDENQSNTNQK
jgi:hypothetical protein